MEPGADFPQAEEVSMSRTLLNSTSLHSAGYCDQLGLEIEFRDGSVYRYAGVPFPIYLALLRAKSQGGFFNSRIRPHFAGTDQGGEPTFALLLTQAWRRLPSWLAFPHHSNLQRTSNHVKD